MGIVKTDEEVKLLEEAALLGDKCFDYVCDFIRPGMTEIDVAKKIYDFFVKNGASSLSFDTIVGAGINSSQIHSTPTEKIIQDKDIVLLDFGCVLNNYCSDMSRTIFIGAPTEKQIQIYNLVLEAHQTAVENIRIGDKASIADMYGRKNIKNAGYDYAHSLGHGIGEKVHEEPVVSYKNDQTVLEKNMVFTIEPGIYLENEFGVRIEDAAVLTSKGVKLLSHSNRNIVVL